jgi:hypothetical protein
MLHLMWPHFPHTSCWKCCLNAAGTSNWCAFVTPMCGFTTCRYWLHPQRFKTELCQFGAKCNRSVCFYAHSMTDLRVSLLCMIIFAVLPCCVGSVV